MNQQNGNRCPKCGKVYAAPPAISRTGNGAEVCPRCGTLEALAAAGIDADTVAEVIQTIDQLELSQGRT